MKKYNEALHALAHYSGFLYTLPKMPLEEAILIMKELVDKATPKKTTWHEEFGTYQCSCGEEVMQDQLRLDDMFRDDKFCSICGQAIDWSEE